MTPAVRCFHLRRGALGEDRLDQLPALLRRKRVGPPTCLASLYVPSWIRTTCFQHSVRRSHGWLFAVLLPGAPRDFRQGEAINVHPADGAKEQIILQMAQGAMDGNNFEKKTYSLTATQLHCGIKCHLSGLDISPGTRGDVATLRGMPPTAWKTLGRRLQDATASEKSW